MAKKDHTEGQGYSNAQGSLNAFLDRGSAFEGKLTFKGSVRIDGKFTGDVMSDDTLLIGESGKIVGTATVGEADIGGVIEGKLTVLGTAYVRPSGRIEGELHTTKLIVDDGGVINGSINMAMPDSASQAKEIQEEVEKTLA